MSASDLPEDLDPRISGALEKLSAEFQQRLADTRDEIVRLMAPAPAAEEPAAEPAPAASGIDALEEVKQAITQIDKGSSQAEILSALLAGAGRFASRSALFLLRPDGLTCWGSYGLEDGSAAPEGLVIGGEPDSAWRRITSGEGGIALSADDCKALCEPLGLQTPNVGVLLPFILGDQVAAALYADRMDDEGSLDISALQILTFSAGQVLETLPVRRRTATATLRLAESAPAPVPALPDPEPAEAPSEQISSAGLYATETEPWTDSAIPSGGADLPDIADSPDIEELPEVVLPKPGFLEDEAPAVEAEPEAADFTGSLEPTPEFEMELDAGDYGLEESGLEDTPAPEEGQSQPPPDFEIPDQLGVDAAVETPFEAPAPPAAPPVAAVPEPAEAPAAADLGAGSSTQVAPPDDVQGPGWAFTTTRISPEVGEEAQHEEARRLARLLVTEIKLYNEEQVQQGRLAKDIYSRLKEDIDRSQQIYDERIGESIRSQGRYFREALVRILGGGDESTLGA